MYLLAFLLTMVGTYVLYIRSEKVTHVPFNWESKLNFGRKYLGWTAILYFVTALILFYLQAGMLGGLSIALVCFFCVASAIMLIRPLLTAEKSKKQHASK